MNSRGARRALEAAGWTFLRFSKGDEMLFVRGDRRILVPDGKPELSCGLTRKLRTLTRPAKENTCNLASSV